MLGGLVFGGLLSFGLVLYATEDHPSALFKEYFRSAKPGWHTRSPVSRCLP
jgi:hypothetical protein